jgi:hypothetical protein
MPISNFLPLVSLIFQSLDIPIPEAMQALDIERPTYPTPLPAAPANLRNENCRNPRPSLMIPITGSTVHLRKP